MLANEDPLRATVEILDQVAGLSDQLDPTTFCAACDQVGGSTVGQHVRHCLDHVAALARGLQAGKIDYDARDRDRAVETDPALAAQFARDLGDQLERAVSAVGLAHVIDVRSACALEGSVPFQASTCGRELQFLVNHTVHHLAMIAAIGRLHGADLDDDLGVAPSTRRHRSATDAAQ